MSNLSYSKSGFSTIEMLMAIAIFMLIIPAVLVVAFANQSLALDSQTASEAQHKAQKYLEQAEAMARNDYSSPVADAVPVPDPDDPTVYQKQLIIDPLAAGDCGKPLQVNITWKGDHNRNEWVTATSSVANAPLALALGGDCAFGPPVGPPGGITPTGTPLNLGGDKTNGLDVLDHKVYLAMQNNTVGFVIIDTTDVDNPICHGTGAGPCSPYANGFSSGAYVYDIDVAKASDGKTYAYIARDSLTQQLEVVDVTDPARPLSIKKMGLIGISPPGAANSQGYRVFYFKNTLYLTTRETGGKEFHVFDVTTPWDAGSITEYTNPQELNRTVTDFTVVEQTISGTTYTIAYLSAKAGLKEVSAWDVTDPDNMIEIPLSINNLAGSNDALSLYFSYPTQRLYVGRDGGTLYVFDVARPFDGVSGSPGFPLLGSTNSLGVDPLGIRVAGGFVYIASEASTEEFKVIKGGPVDFSEVYDDNLSNKGSGIDMEDGIVYESILQGSNSLQLYNVP